MFLCLLAQSLSGALGNACREGMFQICIQPLVRIQFRTVAWKVEHLDPVLVLLEPRHDGLAVMDLQIVHDKEDLARNILDQTLHELDQTVRIEDAVDHHPVAFALVVDG